MKIAADCILLMVAAVCFMQAFADAPPAGITTVATVDRVIDGDTIHVSVTKTFRVRILDCWAPETRGENRDAGIESKRHLQSIIPQGSKITVHIPAGRTVGDSLSFGRVLADVYRGNDSVAEMMVEAGQATRERPE